MTLAQAETIQKVASEAINKAPSVIDSAGKDDNSLVAMAVLLVGVLLLVIVCGVFIVAYRLFAKQQDAKLESEKNQETARLEREATVAALGVETHRHSKDAATHSKSAAEGVYEARREIRQLREALRHLMQAARQIDDQVEGVDLQRPLAMGEAALANTSDVGIAGSWPPGS